MGLAQEAEALAIGMDQAEALKMRLSLKHLIEPGYGMGEAMKALIQYRGVEPPALQGLRPLGELNWSWLPKRLGPIYLAIKMKGTDYDNIGTQWITKKGRQYGSFAEIIF